MSGIATITSEGAFDATVRKQINANFTTLGGAVVAVGNVYFLDPANGSDGNTGLSSTSAFQTLATAYAACTAGNNDTIVLMANGGTSSTARVDAAFTWSKNETHLFGFCAPVLFSQRSRIAPTGTTTAFANFFTVSASGCVFQNVEWFHGFNTGTTSQICMTITGSRNYFRRCHFAGMGDAASAGSAGSRSVKIGSAGSGENYFEECTFGIDTVSRGATNTASATLELAGNTPRNAFRRCLFVMDASTSYPLHILGTGAACIDREQIFDNCIFMNSIASGGTTISEVGSFTNAAPGGLVAMHNCYTVGATKWGDTNFLANCYIDMPVVSQAAGGLALTAS